MIYLIYGEERYLVNKKLEELKLEYENKYDPLSLGLNYIVLNNLESIDELITEIEIPPFGYENKCIVVRGSGVFPEKKNSRKSSTSNDTDKKDSIESTELLKYFKENNNILNSVDVIFVEYSINSNKLIEYIKKLGNAFEYKELTKNDNLVIVKILEEYITDFNKEFNINISISKFDLNYFIEEVGRDLYTLLNDLNKLLFYSYNDNRIEKEDIDYLVNKSTDSVVFDISNNILSGQYSKTLKAIDNLIYSGTDIYVLLGYIYGVYRNIYLVMLAEENGINPKNVLSQNQAFLVSKYQSYTRRIGKEKLEKIVFEIMEIDRLSKVGLIDAELGIKAILKEG